MGLLRVSFSNKVIAAPIIPKMKKKIIRLSFNLYKAPRMIGPNVVAVVPAMLTEFTPRLTALVG